MMKLLYKNKSGVCIVELGNGRYYYGNGKTFGGIGVSPDQFLRFNPSLVYVGDNNEPVPNEIKQWIDDNT